MTNDRKLILFSFSRVGLSLPIDGSKDDEISIQGGEHLMFQPIVDEGALEEGLIVFQDVEEKRSAVKPTSVCKSMSGEKLGDLGKEIYSEVASLTVNRAKRAKRVIPNNFFVIPKGCADDYAYDRYSDHWYDIDRQCTEVEDSIWRCKDEDTSMRLEDRLLDAIGLMDDLRDFCEEIREKISKQLEFDQFSLASQVLMYADPVPDVRLNKLQAELNYIQTWVW